MDLSKKLSLPLRRTLDRYIIIVLYVSSCFLLEPATIEAFIFPIHILSCKAHHGFRNQNHCGQI